MTVQFRDLGDSDSPPDDLTMANIDPDQLPADAIFQSGVRIAYRFEADYTGRFIHVFGLGWYLWATTHWKEVKKGEVTQALLALIRRTWPEAQTDKSLETALKEVQKVGEGKVLNWAKNLESFAHTADELDGDRRLVNLQNGTLDLNTFSIKEHDRADLITHQMNAAYNYNGLTWEQEAPLWKRFIEEVVPDSETRRYLQIYAGTALSGEVLEHALAVLFGSGRNGKGVFYEALLHVFGTYGLQADPALFHYREGSSTTSQTDLLGKRFVVFSETSRGGAFNVALLKRLAGGDAITARRMRQDNITFEPSHTPFLVTNWMPRIPADEGAAWERVAIVPFDVYIAPENRDKQLKYKLRREADGILKWLVEGWSMYQQAGYLLEVPARVIETTSEHRDEVDYIGGFIEDHCVLDPNARVLQSELRAAYNMWRMGLDKTRDEAPQYAQNDFATVIKRRGHEAAKGAKNKSYFLGIRLRVPGELG